MSSRRYRPSSNLTMRFKTAVCSFEVMRGREVRIQVWEGGAVVRLGIQ